MRQATASDAGFVASLVPRFAEHGPHPGHTVEEVITGTTRVLTHALAHPVDDDLFLIAEDDDGTPLGFAYVVTSVDFFTEARYAHVSEIAVARSGEGAGAALMAEAERWARAREYPQLTLNTVETNDAARRFYRREGFVPAYRQLFKRL